LYDIPHPQKGEHKIEAKLKYLKDNSVRTIKKKFVGEE